MDQISDFLTRRKMDFAALEGGGISTAFSPSEDNSLVFGLFILPFEDSLGDRYVRFTVVPFVGQHEDGYPTELYAIVGQANHDLPQVKFAFDADGDLELLVDVRGDQLDDDQFQRALQLLADYGSAYYPQITQIIGI